LKKPDKYTASQYINENIVSIFRIFLLLMVGLSSFYSFGILDINREILLKVSILFDVMFLMLFAFSLSKFIVNLYKSKLLGVSLATLLAYFSFLIFYNINYVIAVILVIFLTSYFFQWFRQIIFFTALSIILLAMIFVYSNFNLTNKLFLLTFVAAYNVYVFYYLNRNFKIKQALSFNDTLLQLLYEEINEGLIIVDAHSNTVLRCNSQFSEIFEIPDNTKLIGSNGYKFVAHIIEDYISTKKENNKLWEKSYMLTSYKGKKFWSEVTINSINENDSKYFILKIVDITEKKQKEEIIEKLSLALKQNPGIIIIFNKEGIIEYVNQKYIETTGFTYKEIVGTRIYNLGFKMNEPVKKIWVKFNTNNAWSGEVQTFGKNGNLIYARISVSSVISANNQVERFIVVGEDITLQKNAELAAQIAQQKNDAILQAIPDLMFVLDKNGIFKDFKKDSSEELLLPPEKIIGANIRDIGLPEEALNLSLIRLEQIICKKSVSENYQYNAVINGHTEYYESRMIALGDDEVLAIIRNITKRVIAEQTIIENERNYKNLVEYSPNGIILHKDEEIFYANNTALKTLGLKSVEEITGLMSRDLIISDQQEILADRLDKVRSGEDVPFTEFMLVRPVDKKVIEIEAKPTLLEYNGEKVFQIVFRDISVEKRLQREKRRAEHAEEINEELKTEMLVRKQTEIELKKSLIEKEVLLKEVHHRVKNNMQIISSILNLQAGNIQSPEIKKLFDESQDRIKAMALVHENLYRTKDFANIDFEQYVRNLVGNLYRSYDVDGMRITYELDLEKILLTIDIGIPCGLIINELISNSIKHAFGKLDKGIIFVSLKKVGNLVTLIVGDNGKGIDENVNILETQSLGFQLVTALVQQIDGNISIEKVAGTKFIITFTV
jgi:PAS domain S-box-containing protein